MERLRRIERAERNLWLLALMLFLLLAVSVFLIDAGSTAVSELRHGVPAHVAYLLGKYEVSAALLLVVALICGYFYEKVAALRQDNRALVNAVESSARLLSLRNTQLDTWHQVSHGLVTNFNLPRLLELIGRTASDMTESDCAAVVLVEPARNALRLVAIHQHGLEIELGRRVAAAAVREGHAIHLHEAEVPPEFDRPDLPWDDLVAIAAVPLIEDKKAVGALLVGRLDPGEPFLPEAMNSLASFASQAAVALGKANLYAENRRQLDQLSSVVQELQSQTSGSPAGRRSPDLESL